MEKYQLAKIIDCGGDMSARWYVEYKYRNPDTDKFQKFREWISSKLLTRTARSTKALQVKNNINLKLKSGYSPFEIKERQKYIAEALHEVLDIKKSICGKRANTTYTSISNMFIDWLDKHNLQTLRPGELNKSICQKFLDHLLIEKKVSNRTYNNYLASLRTLFECLHERDYTDFNVWKKIAKLKTKQSDISFFTEEERALLNKQLPDEHYPLYCVALLIYYCYLRPAEIVRLRFSDFDLKNGQIFIKASQSKNGDNNIVIMHPALVESLRKLNFTGYPSAFYLFGTSKKLLPSNKEIAPTRIADAWRLIVKEKIGINKNIYDLKPTGAGAAFESGIDARNIQLQIRHHSLEQTQIYLDKYINKPGTIFKEKMPVF